MQTVSRTKKYSNPLYSIYAGMKKRCYTKSDAGFKNYGAKGIKVCEEWKNDFNAFYDWAIKTGYSYDPTATFTNKLSIDRIDPTKDYTPANCRWLPFGENSARAGRGAIFTEERRQKIANAKRGTKASEETRKKQSLAHLGKGIGNTYAAKGFYKMYTKNGEYIKTFKARKEISIYFLENHNKRLTSYGTIHQAATHKRQTAYGYKWEYICK